MPQQAENVPFHLAGAYAPVLEELTLHDLEVIGRVPPDLRGTYVRNGPNPRSGVSPSWFAGEGMLHGIRIEDGRAVWYRNRWIGGDYAPNTSVVAHAGRLLALVESRLPVEITRDLETVGPFSFGAEDLRSVIAHPKKCPHTGELVFISYGRERPHVTYYRADGGGRIVHRAPIDVPATTYMHDIAITERHTVIWDLPVLIGDYRSPMPFRWSDDYRARVGIIPRDGREADVRWFDVASCMIIHTVNAFEDGDLVVLDVLRAPRMMMPAELFRFTFDLRTGETTEDVIDSRFVDLPRIHPAVEGKPYRFAYGVELRDWEGGGFQNTTLRKYDMQARASVVHPFVDSRMAGECVIAPRAGATSEDDAWAMLFVYDKSRDASDFVILDARRFEAEPVATIRLPCRVPVGFHGAWIPDPPTVQAP
jgi:carotenoid cleavage dioxygenase